MSDIFAVYERHWFMIDWNTYKAIQESYRRTREKVRKEFERFILDSMYKEIERG
ncbi:MAG: hypothetical protein ACUZ8I_07350 [Candidatus Scalindua sp.]